MTNTFEAPFMRLVFAILVGLFTAVIAQAADPSVELQNKGTTNANTLASVSFSLKDAGARTLALTDWLVELKIGGTAINVPGATLNRLSGVSGNVTANGINVPAGKYNVQIKVKLDNGTFAIGSLEVDFQRSDGGGLMDGEAPPPPPPPPSCP